MGSGTSVERISRTNLDPFRFDMDPDPLGTNWNGSYGQNYMDPEKYP